MKSKIAHSTLGTLTAFLLLVTANASAEEGELWQVEVKVEMVGMPTMPAQSVKQCIPKRSETEREEMMIPKDTSCKTTDFKKNGNKTRFSMTCNRQGTAMTGSGEFEQQGSDRYRGKMQMVMNSGGQKMEMNQSFSGRRLGKCEYQAR